MKTARSYLFAPGERPERFAKAASSGADRVVIDLEDAVGFDRKDDARRAAASWFANGGNGVVRINAADTPWFDDGLAAAEASPAPVIMVPRAEPRSVRSVAGRLPGRLLIALVETVEGLIGLSEVARSPGVTRLAFGHLDFGLDARIPGAAEQLDPVRFQLAIWSRRTGLDQPIDGVTVDLDDTDRLATAVARARSCGFSAKLCIHPKQVACVNEGFAPDARKLDWARRVLEAAKRSGGAVVRVDGKMVDHLVFEMARTILADE